MHRTVVRGLAAGAVAGLLVAPAVPAPAAPSTSERIALVTVNCTIDLGDALIEVDGVLDEISGDSAFRVLVLTLTEFFGPDPEASADIVFEPSSVSGSIPMLRFPVDGDPEPAGMALVDLTLTPVGEPEAIRESNTGSNARSRQTGERQPLVVSGSLSVAGLTVDDFTGCEAERVDITIRQNDPDTVVAGLGAGWTQEAHCVALQGEGGLSLNLERKNTSGGFDIAMPDGSFFSGVARTAEWHPGLLTGTYDVTDGEGAPVGTASVRITEGELIFEDELVDTLGPFRRMYHLRVFDASGELTLPDGTVIGLTCELLEQSGFAITHTPSGPTPSNDLPENALPIVAGQQVEVRTSGAAEDPEVPSECAEFGVDHTVWYTFVGTGGEVTLDTGGSDFDTVIDVYSMTPDGELVGVACVDDLPDGNRIASLTLEETAEGVTYLVQVGGSNGQSGRLILTRSP